MAAVGNHRVGREEGTVGGGENCTLRRFRIRGLIEGMLRTVMGNICRGQSQSAGGQRCKKVTGQRSPGGQRKETRQHQEREGRNGGGIWRKKRNRTWDWKARKWDGKGEKRRGKRNTKRGTSIANYWPGVAKGNVDVLCTILFSKNVKVCKFVWCCKSLLVAYHQAAIFQDLCASRSPLTTSQASRLQWGRGGASLATKRVQQCSYSAHPDLLWPTVQHKAVQYAASVEMTSMHMFSWGRDMDDPAGFPTHTKKNQLHATCPLLQTVHISTIFLYRSKTKTTFIWYLKPKRSINDYFKLHICSFEINFFS